MTWFSTLTGFVEGDVRDVASMFELDGEWMTSRANGRRMRHGRFELLSVDELRRRASEAHREYGELRASQVVDDAQSLHADPDHAGAVFQAASQFNALEMVDPRVTPEAGVTWYERDRTQGPACAVACGAGTIYRNWLVPVGDGIGQTARRQLDALAELAAALGVSVPMRNGYAFPTRETLRAVDARITGSTPPERDALMGRLKVGVQWGTEVTVRDAGHAVTQVYCSALPIAYSTVGASLEEWEPLARLVLDATYEATFLVALVNAAETGSGRLFLTTVGSGVFGNPKEWVLGAIERCLVRWAFSPLEVAVVSHRSADPAIERVVAAGDPWADRLFEAPPWQWGLRGDPYLWSELRATLRRCERPATAEGVGALVRASIEALCGPEVWVSDDPLRMPRYPTSGMSGGLVDPRWWRREGLPNLLDKIEHMF